MANGDVSGFGRVGVSGGDRNVGSAVDLVAEFVAKVGLVGNSDTTLTGKADLVADLRVGNVLGETGASVGGVLRRRTGGGSRVVLESAFVAGGVTVVGAAFIIGAAGFVALFGAWWWRWGWRGTGGVYVFSVFGIIAWTPDINLCRTTEIFIKTNCVSWDRGGLARHGLIARQPTTGTFVSGNETARICTGLGESTTTC